MLIPLLFILGQEEAPRNLSLNILVYKRRFVP
jgi:hypothetical protein